MKWLCSSSLSYKKFCTKTDTGDKIKYYRFSNNKIHRENTKEKQLKLTGIKDAFTKSIGRK